MKAIIEGKKYDSETAHAIAEYSSPHPVRDFRHLEETLYRTLKGSWFLAGEGGPMTKYSQPCHGGTSGGERIIPLSDYEAREWLADHGFVEECETHFKSSIEEA